jgi:signal transduction histidine kinase
VGILIDKFNDMEDQLALHEAELEKKNMELMQTKKLAAIGTLAAGVAHELNNPLNNIYLSTQVLAREVSDTCPPDMKEVFNDILSQTVRVKKIVGDLLEFARGREPHLQEIELNGLIRGLFKRFRSDGGSIACTLATDQPEVLVWADQGQLEQVFINLFTNAVEAMAGRGELRVNISSAGDHAAIQVADSGPGIFRESLEKIFEPFFTTKDKGTGLGLAIVYNLIKKNHGEIVVASEEN